GKTGISRNTGISENNSDDKNQKAALNPRLVWVLAQINSESEETQKQLLALLTDTEQDEKVRLAAARGLEFFPKNSRETATSALVEVLNQPDVPAKLATEARLVLKRLQNPPSLKKGNPPKRETS
ncbi:MAG: HEAT repeat domain-containing protein, partial [Planctomycetia bacterium]|nr:HEAT repeat domain-containing protein [Planctomycetia bacterium]